MASIKLTYSVIIRDDHQHIGLIVGQQLMKK